MQATARYQPARGNLPWTRLLLASVIARGHSARRSYRPRGSDTRPSTGAATLAMKEAASDAQHDRLRDNDGDRC
ncbi:hypothetical protein B296_00045508 [Ensete ventricosum]|uniref:Uncharacterized protein n=1 Tax=Ensete ventricosum TaxID=4639 RepID=A0A426YKE6_ENSVE|nr:hypothetical protein B296_00045508 [Ensete ventricosum]